MNALTRTNTAAPVRRRLLLVNPLNNLCAITNTGDNGWNQFRIWKPLGLAVLAARTPPEWEVEIVDENLGVPDYEAMPAPDLVGISAFTSQANAAYALSARFRARGVPVVMGGVHATMRTEEAASRVDSVVTGEGDDVWEEVLRDVDRGALKPLYHGGHADMARVLPARHDLLAEGYAFGSLQVSRGCPLNCSFCSVTEFNGRRLRSRPIESVIEELGKISEPLLLITDDNLIGTSKRQIARAKELFRAMIAAPTVKHWMGQVTINFADDDELMELAARAGCFGVLIGFESPTAEGLRELKKSFNRRNGRDLRASVQRIQRHGMIVAGSFALGLDCDRRGIGRRIASAGRHYGLDVINTLFLTPLPGTRLFRQLEAEGRLVANDFPADWKYYTFTYPVSRFQHLSWPDAAREMADVNRHFYAFPLIARRVLRTVWRSRALLGAMVSLVTNLSYRFNRQLESRAFSGMEAERQRRPRRRDEPEAGPQQVPIRVPAGGARR